MVGERDIHCRASWFLKGYDVNKAGQVHAYLCDLRLLPYEEQLHWVSYNEAPKDGISKEAFTTDFKGEFLQTERPLGKILSKLDVWEKTKPGWWTLRDPELPERVSVPYSGSADDWAEAFMDLSKLLVEGFEIKSIRSKLDDAGIVYDAKDQSIGLLEKLTGASLPYLREVQRIRSKVKGHSGSSEARAIRDEAINQHGTFATHFKHVCHGLAGEIERIKSMLT